MRTIRRLAWTRSALALFTAATTLALCAMLAGPSLATNSSDPPHPALADCTSIWNDSSAAETCTRNLTVGTEPGLCTVTVDCPRGGTYQATSTVGAGCYLHQSGGPNSYKYFCTNTETYRDNDDTELVNCSAVLYVASSCATVNQED